MTASIQKYDIYKYLFTRENKKKYSCPKIALENKLIEKRQELCFTACWRSKSHECWWFDGVLSLIDMPLQSIRDLH